MLVRPVRSDSVATFGCNQPSTETVETPNKDVTTEPRPNTPTPIIEIERSPESESQPSLDPNCPEKERVDQERNALIAIYEATDGDNWHKKDNWLSGVPLGYWHGVQTDECGNVIALSLFRNNLNGSIPDEIASLSLLQSLGLSDNSLSGQIPATLGSLPTLYNLHLHSNNLSGTVPDTLGRSVPLTRMSISGNELEGCIPSHLRSALSSYYEHRPRHD